MADFFYLWTAAFGLWFALAESLLFCRPRTWLIVRSKWARELFACPYCLGTHTSLWMTLLACWAGVPLMYNDPASLVVGTLGGGAFCYILNDILLWLEAEAGE